MDILAILGWIFGFGLIVISCFMGTDPETGKTILIPEQLMGFYDLPSIMIVLGGTIAALMVSYSVSDFKKIPKHLKIILRPKKYNPLYYIEQITEFAREARSNGLLALEDKLNETKEPFLKNSLLLVVDSVDPDKVNSILETELDYLEERHYRDMSFYLKASEFSPAFGMVGTLVGLINLLGNLSDTDALATNMAVALITTLYGVVLANLIFKPIANKLKLRHEEEYLCKVIISEGVKAIQDGDNPNFISEKLMRLLNENLAKNGRKNGATTSDKGSKK